MRRAFCLWLLVLSLAVAQSGWQPYQSPDNSFSCEFPPGSSGGPEPSDPGDFSVAYLIKSPSGELYESFSAAYIQGDPTEFDLKALLMGAASADSKLVKGPREFKQAGVDAVEATWIVPDPNGEIILTMRLLRGTDRTYLGTVTGLSSNTALAAKAQTFLDSIRLGNR